jgi:glycine/D-amino acid oxidase-like deaminating enzyme/nitrite reductase/ring-hydroxylating ferredoxin subunit
MKILRDGDLASPWQLDITYSNHTTLNNTVYDCLIVGAGITGLTAALLLQQAGKQTAIAEAHMVGFGTTGGTSAHINTFADTTYADAESAFGADGAKLFAEAIAEGFAFIKANAKNCDYETKPGYIYAETDSEVKALDKIYEGAVKVDVAVNYADDVPTPVKYQKALVFAGQAQFHPIKYLQQLTEAYVNAGGMIFENTRIEKVETENGVHSAGNIKAKAVIYATHMPPNINVFNFECAPYRSYVIAAELENEHYPDELIYDSQEPYHYVRTHIIDGQKLLLVGGNDHKTGHDDPGKAFADLEEYVRKYYPVSAVKFRWSSQYYVPVDGLPYIGQLPLSAPGIYCATGYNGNGMMLGSVAGKILSDLVQEKENKYADLFKPSRVKPIDSLPDIAKENADVAYHFIADRFNIPETDSLNKLAPGTGKLVELDGKKIAAYKDEKGVLHALSPVCTHTGCIVNWNGEEKSWDCPCHGARYDVDGNVLTGPATKNLATIQTEQNVQHN